jgi:hypothetical protein
MLTLVVVAESAIVLFLATAFFGLGTALYGVSRFTILDKIALVPVPVPASVDICTVVRAAT